MLQLDQEVGHRFGWDEAFGFLKVSRFSITTDNLKVKTLKYDPTVRRLNFLAGHGGSLKNSANLELARPLTYLTLA